MVTTGTIKGRLAALPPKPQCRQQDAWEFPGAGRSAKKCKWHYFECGERFTRPDGLPGQPGSIGRIDASCNSPVVLVLCAVEQPKGVCRRRRHCLWCVPRLLACWHHFSPAPPVVTARLALLRWTLLLRFAPPPQLVIFLRKLWFRS